MNRSLLRRYSQPSKATKLFDFTPALRTLHPLRNNAMEEKYYPKVTGLLVPH